MSVMNEVHDIMNKTCCGSDRKSGHTREGEGMNAKKWDVYVYGDVNIDIVIPGVEKFPEPGQEDEVSVMETFVGGGAALFTLGVGKLGLHPVFQGEVGDDCYGELIRNKFRESHVDDSLLVISKELKTGISLSFTNEKDRSFLTYRGTNEKISIVNVDVEKVKEESYFFKLGKYTDQWLKFIEENPDFIQPESRRNEMIQFVKQGLEDLAVSRTSFDWGIKVPFDPKHVVYVWFDALVNYISALSPFDGDGELYKKYWPADLHLVGKEIVRFHTIIWPMMLMSLELPLPKKVFGHGWMIVDGTKMSKSLGNVIDPIPLIDTYGADSLRYYLLSEITLGNDGNFTLPNFVTKINADLSNDLGNLLNRTIAMIEKYHDGVITKCDDMDDLDRDVSTLAVQTVKEFEAAMENMELNKGIKAVWALIGRMNKYIDETMPWVLAKSEDANDKARLQSAMYHLAEALRIIAILVSPVIPVGAPKIWDQLGLAGFGDATLEDAKTWGVLPTGTKVVKGEPIYPRFEIPEMVEATPVQAEEAVDTSNIPPLKENITYDDFEKLDLRVAKVVSCEKVPKSKKLLKFVLDIGIEERTVLSGISQYYEPEAMVGKKVIYLSNLAPKKMMGIESYGMILSASDWEEHLEVTNIESLPAGSVVK